MKDKELRHILEIYQGEELFNLLKSHIKFREDIAVQKSVDRIASAGRSSTSDKQAVELLNAIIDELGKLYD